MKYITMAGIIVLGMLAFLIEVTAYIQDPWQMLNPLFQWTVIGYFFSSPLVWVVFPLTLLFGVIQMLRNRN